MIENEKALTCIRENYIVDTDMEIIQKWASDKSVTLVSFRSAGKDTIEKLQKGAGAKPHSILEKTIKSQEGLEKELWGLVAHRDKGIIKGLYLTEYGYKLLSKSDSYMNSITSIASEKNTLWILNLKDIDDLLCNDLQNDTLYSDTDTQTMPVRANYKCFFTGDYDGHDLLQAYQPVVSGLDTELFADLQTALYESWQKQFNPSHTLENINKADYQRVQHGVQYNYIAQMLDENRHANSVSDLNVIVDKVGDYSTPLVVLLKSSEKFKWMIAERFEDLVQLYHDSGLTLKNTWADPVKRKSILSTAEDMLRKSQLASSEDDIELLKEKIQLQKHELDELIKKLQP